MTPRDLTRRCKKCLTIHHSMWAFCQVPSCRNANGGIAPHTVVRAVGSAYPKRYVDDKGLITSAKPPLPAQGQTLEEKIDALSEKMDHILTLLEERKIHEWAKDLDL